MSDNPNPISKRIAALPEATIIAMAQRARDLAAQGHDVINLTVGQPDFDTPTFIKEAAKQALDEGKTKYTPVPGTPELRQAIAEKFKTENNIDYTADEIVVSNGAKQSILNVCLALLNPGDEVLLTAPYWTSYLGLVLLAEANPIVCHAGVEENFKVPASRLEAALTNKTRLLILNTPSNPTGAVYTHDELAAIADMMTRHEQLYVVCDEIYEYINFTGQHASLASFAQARARTITVNGFSKAFAMTGWRLGYMGSAPWLAQACAKIQANVTSGASSFAQAAAITALKSDRAAVAEMIREYHARRDLVVKQLSAMPGVKISPPDGSFYAFPDISHFLGRIAKGHAINTTADFCKFLLEEFYLSTVPGSAFGDDKSIRLSFAASEQELTQALERLGQALASFS